MHASSKCGGLRGAPHADTTPPQLFTPSNPPNPWSFALDKRNLRRINQCKKLWQDPLGLHLVVPLHAASKFLGLSKREHVGTSDKGVVWNKEKGEPETLRAYLRIILPGFLFSARRRPLEDTKTRKRISLSELKSSVLSSAATFLEARLLKPHKINSCPESMKEDQYVHIKCT